MGDERSDSTPSSNEDEFDTRFANAGHLRSAGPRFCSDNDDVVVTISLSSPSACRSLLSFSFVVVIISVVVTPSSTSTSSSPPRFASFISHIDSDVVAVSAATAVVAATISVCRLRGCFRTNRITD